MRSWAAAFRFLQTPSPACTVGRQQSRRTQKIGVLPANIVRKKHMACTIRARRVRHYSFAYVFICVWPRALCSVICYRQRGPDKFDVSFAFIQFEYECRRARIKRIHRIRSQHCMGLGAIKCNFVCVLKTCVRLSVCLSGSPFSCPRRQFLILFALVIKLHSRERTIGRADRPRRPQVYDLDSNCTPLIHLSPPAPCTLLSRPSARPTRPN